MPAEIRLSGATKRMATIPEICISLRVIRINVETVVGGGTHDDEREKQEHHYSETKGASEEHIIKYKRISGRIYIQYIGLSVDTKSTFMSTILEICKIKKHTHRYTH